MNKKIFLSIFLVSVAVSLALMLFIFCTHNLGSADVMSILGSAAVFIPLVSLVLSFFVAHMISNSITKKINEIDIKRPSAKEQFEELSPLLSKLAAHNRMVNRNLKEAERRQEEFRLITEDMSEGFITTDEVGNVLTYNSAALRLLNDGKPLRGNILAINRTRDFKSVIYSALDGKRAETETVLDERTYNIFANPVFDDEKIIGAIILILDVTESFRREQLRREFTSNVSHELKTPLTSISGFAEIMKSGSTDEETVIDFSSSIYDEAQRLISLVSDIIKLTELDEGSIAFEKTDVDLFSLAENTISHLKPSAEKRGVTLSLTGEPATVCGAYKILDEMIYNLCDNAIKYNKENGKVTIDVTKSDMCVTVTVTDTGIGIPESEQARVFERFYRVDKSHSRELGGTGLGLSIVKHGAIFHNAQINLTSKLNVGTSVSVVFTI